MSASTRHDGHGTMFNNARNINIHGGAFTVGGSEDRRKGTMRHLCSHVAGGAFHNSAERYDPPKCHPETREAVITKITEWVEADYLNKLHFMWMYGPAGSGKSAIAQTIAELCHERGLLAASFFFSRTAPGRSDPTGLISTLAYQLAIIIPEMIDHISDALEHDPMLISRSLEAQMQALILTPLLKISTSDISTDSDHKPPGLIIIDGLDECGEPHMQRAVIEVLLFAILQKIPYPLFFLIASRPEQVIRDAFNAKQTNLHTKRLVLDDTYHPDADIRRYLLSEFQKLKETHPLGSQLSDPWPSEENIDQLVENSSGQFIYAVTVSRVIASPSLRPTHTLTIVLKLTDPGNLTPFAALDALYSHILDSALEFDKVAEILGFLILSKTLVRQPSVIEDFLSYMRGDIQIILGTLHSIIDVPDFGKNGDLRIFHASIVDFLLDPSRSGEYYIDSGATYTSLARRCMNNCLSLMQVFRSGSRPRLETYQLISRNGLLSYLTLSLPTGNKELLLQFYDFDLAIYLNLFTKDRHCLLYTDDWLFDELPLLFECVQRIENPALVSNGTDTLYDRHLGHLDTYLQTLFGRYPKETRMKEYFAIASMPEEDIEVFHLLRILHTAIVGRNLWQDENFQEADYQGLTMSLTVAPETGRNLRDFKMVSDFLTNEKRAGSFFIDEIVYNNLTKTIISYIEERQRDRLSDMSHSGPDINNYEGEAAALKLLSASLFRCRVTPQLVAFLRAHPIPQPLYSLHPGQDDYVHVANLVNGYIQLHPPVTERDAKLSKTKQIAAWLERRFK